MAVVAPMFPNDNSILKQMCQPAIQTILNFENSESIRIEQKNAIVKSLTAIRKYVKINLTFFVRCFYGNDNRHRRRQIQ